MSNYSITLLSAAISTLLISTFVYLRKPKDKVVQSFFLLTIILSFWLVGCFGESVSKTRSTALYWDAVLYTGVSLYPLVYLNFLFSILEIRKKKRIFVPVGALSLVFLIFNYAQQIRHYLIRDVAKKFTFRFIAVPNTLWFILVLFVMIIGTYGVILKFRVYKKTTGYKRNQMKYLFIAYAILTAGGGMYFLLPLSIKIPPIDASLVTLFSAIIAYTIVRHRLMDIRLFISHATAFLISYPVFLGVPFFFAYRMRPYLYPLLGVHWWLIPSALLLFFATLAPLAYGKIRSKMEETLLAEQKRYQKLLLQAASGMVREHNLNKLAKLIVYITKRIVKINFAAIFLNEPEEGAYRLRAVRDAKHAFYHGVAFDHGHPFIAYLKTNREPFFYEEMPAQIKKTFQISPQIGLIVPSFIEDNLLGFVFLGEKLNRDPYVEDDINVFKILSHQAALSIENCLFLEESQKFQERIFTAEKLASLGGMADGVSHQIKNRLNHFSIASGELKYEIRDFIEKHSELVDRSSDLKKTFDYLSGIAESLITNVKRTDGVIRGILAFARTEEKDTFFSDFSLKEIINLSLDLLKVKHQSAEFPLKAVIPSSDTLYGVKAQIMECLYNILDNAYEAISDKVNFHLSQEEKDNFKPLIELRLLQKINSSLIEISDNGIGIKSGNRAKIFAPFFTTKSSYKSGTGIGIYVVKRMIEENHKGKITFISEYMKGTKFLIELPKKKK